jgi:hypothetical protein
LGWSKGNCAIGFFDISYGSLQAGWEALDEQGNDREGAPSGGKEVRVDDAVDRCDVISCGMGKGKVLYKAIFFWLAWLWNDPERGGLEGNDEVFKLVS